MDYANEVKSHVSMPEIMRHYGFELADYLWVEINEFLTPCYKKARQARFEYGEKG